MTCEQAERSGIGGIAAKRCLVDVDAHADDAVGDVLALQVALYQGAADFSVAHIDVVGPLHLHPFHIVCQSLSDCDGHALRKQELPRCNDEVGMA